jgi:hypothetical protein
MPKVTLTNADGTTEDFFPQSYTDAAVTAAVAAIPKGVAPTITEVDVKESDGTTVVTHPA